MSEYKFKEGDHIELVKMPDDPDPVPVGTKGIITSITRDFPEQGSTQIGVNWDNDRTLFVIYPIDQIRKISNDNSD